MKFDEAARLVRLQERVKWATREALKEDSHHKSSEAAVSLSFCLPSMFADDQRPCWHIEIYSYVLGEHRNHQWIAATVPEALALAEADVDKWVFPYEMRAFERDVVGDAPDDGPMDPPFGADPTLTTSELLATLRADP